MHSLDQDEEFQGCGCPACTLHHLRCIQREALKAAHGMGKKGKVSFEEIRSMMIALALRADTAYEALELSLQEKTAEEEEPPRPHGYH
jgi:hypothetical protein